MGTFSVAFAKEGSHASPRVVASLLGVQRVKGDFGAWRHWDAYGHEPAHVVGGRPDLASIEIPAIGAYDASDPDAIRWVAASLRLAGIDAVLLWLPDATDAWHSNALIRQVGLFVSNGFSVGLRVRGVPEVLRARRMDASALHWEGKRLLFFEETGNRLVRKIEGARLSDGSELWLHPASPSFTNFFDAAFAVPPNPLRAARTNESGVAWAWTSTEALARHEADRAEFRNRFSNESSVRPLVEAAFAGLDDAAVGGYGKGIRRIERGGGATLSNSLAAAMRKGADFVVVHGADQWNEGSQILPTRERGAEDLRIVARTLRGEDPGEDPFTAVTELQRLRKLYLDPDSRRSLDRIEASVLRSDLAGARAELDRWKARAKREGRWP